MKTSDFDYDLPTERIAQTPVEPRDSSRLLVLDRASGALTHARFSEVERWLRPGDLLVLNQTRVIPARIHGHKPTGGAVELLLLRREQVETWEVLVGGKRMTAGQRVLLEDGLEAEVIQVLEGSRRLVRFNQPVEPYLERAGEMPLPPYVHERLRDPNRYQTVYAKDTGSAAAPTAGLHFTPELLARLESLGIHQTYVTLHVGLDTFAPVTEDDPREHAIHTEWCEVSSETAGQVNAAKREGRRVIAIGTTSVRTLESAARYASEGEAVGSFAGPTNLYVLPGYLFRVVDAMITNFHLPKSTLLMLVSAFAGRERMLETYRLAIQEKYRFYSFGDAMLIL